MMSSAEKECLKMLVPALNTDLVGATHQTLLYAALCTMNEVLTDLTTREDVAHVKAQLVACLSSLPIR